MILNDPELEYLIGSNQNDLSFYDKAELNAFYKCADNCTNPPVCQNGGFVKQVDGVCSCECVDGLTGTDCSQLNTSRGCGGTFNLLTSESAFIDMIGYKRDLSCTWLIKGPEKTKIQVFINSIELPFSTYGNCYHFIEIRDYLSGAKGKQICGNSGGETFTKKNIGPTNVMILRFDSALYNAVRPGKGFTLTATATPSEAERCLLFNYALADNDIGGPYTTTLKVRILSDIFTPDMIFATNSGNKWTSAEMDLPAVNGMKIQFVGSYGIQRMVLDNIRITPLLCYICNENSCLNGVCFPHSSSTYSCKCNAGWSGNKCDINLCANVDCNQGKCEALSETETRCICDAGWYGEFCDINPCEQIDCNKGFCEVVSMFEARCVYLALVSSGNHDNDEQIGILVVQ
uniref:Zinc metalloproteinase nas-36 n=1 Tax=Magallana gigas TaxID=29159 RepID=K1QPB1_MAGGI